VSTVTLGPGRSKTNEILPDAMLCAVPEPV
jgi:hypothetical protein